MPGQARREGGVDRRRLLHVAAAEAWDSRALSSCEDGMLFDGVEVSVLLCYRCVPYLRGCLFTPLPWRCLGMNIECRFRVGSQDELFLGLEII